MASAKDIKTHRTKVDPKAFVAKVANDTRRADAEVLMKMFARVSGWKPYMFGPTIVGYGMYHYTYDSGREGDACVVGFSPRASSLSVYWGGGEPEKTKALFAKLGKHKMGGGGCLYINKLADVDMGVLEKLIAGGVAHMKKKWPVAAT